MEQATHNNQFHEKLKQKADEFAHHVYRITKQFPKDELYGITSQLRRAALSVVLNYIEGYARKHGKNLVYKNFLEISYGSLQESKYLLHFALIEKYFDENEYQESTKQADEIGAMLWTTLKRI